MVSVRVRIALNKYRYEYGTLSLMFVPQKNIEHHATLWYKNMGTSFSHFVTNHAFDRRTDGQTAFSWLDRVACSAVKIWCTRLPMLLFVFYLFPRECISQHEFMIFFGVFAHVGGFPTTMYLCAINVENSLEQFVGSITADSVDVCTAHNAANIRSFILLANVITVTPCCQLPEC